MDNSDNDRRPAHKKDDFECPNCGVYARHSWFPVSLASFDMDTSRCTACSISAVWVESVMIYPATSVAPLPVDGMPDEIRQIFDEARHIFSGSPRAAAALLRLSIQVLMKHLGLPGENLNKDIGELVKEGVPKKIQKALDSVRVVGNNAVHPGQIDIDDNQAMALALFGLVNLIVSATVVQDKELDDIYSQLPEGALEQIERRDNNDS